jgi:glycosyltransferase involved in cell wall biosynthesis
LRILHYSLGFPPYARGGLTKYVIDIAQEQVKQGHEVAMLWPGRINRAGHPKIVKDGEFQGIESYELKNPEYLPQIYGIRDFDKFQIKVNGSVYLEFLKKVNPDVIHIHTLMGMHIDFLEAAQQLKIKTVYTTHDFFGICPKTTLFFNQRSCENNIDCEGCFVCCDNALEVKKMRILQSLVYRTVKNTSIMKKIRERQKGKVFAVEDKIKTVDGSDKIYRDEYKNLRKGYIAYFDKISVIHFNSSYMKKIFSKYMDVSKGVVCNITHSGIGDNRYQYEKKGAGNILQITYMGPIAEYKGFYMLKNVLDKLYEDGVNNFELTIYHDVLNPSPYMRIMPPYEYEHLNEVMNQADLIVALNDVSYGFTVLEALSYGVPVFVTEEVGAKDMVINHETGIICEYCFDSIKKEMEKLLSNVEIVENLKKNLKEMSNVPLIDEHVKTLVDTFYQQK